MKRAREDHEHQEHFSSAGTCKRLQDPQPFADDFVHTSKHEASVQCRQQHEATKPESTCTRARPFPEIDFCERLPAFQLSPATRFNEKFPHFREPAEIGCFCQDAERKFQADKSQLKYYCQPRESKINFNLREGYGTFIKKDENVKEFIDDLLRWIDLNRSKFNLPHQQNVPSLR